MKSSTIIMAAILLLLGCNSSETHNYSTLLEHLKSQEAIIELATNSGQSRLIVSPHHQGKIIASTYSGLSGNYNGWVNPLALENPSENIGGEERLWLGPLGSQFSFYFQQIKPIHDDNWKVPDAMGGQPYDLVFKDENRVELSKNMQLTNFIGTTFNLEVKRNISILSKKTIENYLNSKLNTSTNFVAFETHHTLKNLDTVAWTADKGLVGLWSAGMYAGDDSVVIIPLKNKGGASDILTYLAPIDNTRLTVKKNVVLFKGDGQYRSKMGVPPEFSPDIYGCYSKANHKLTIVHYKKEMKDSLYSNSYVSIQTEPYKGEAIPIYNNSSDFFELESQASLKELQPNETTSHWHRVYHFSDEEQQLNLLSKSILGIDLNDCTF